MRAAAIAFLLAVVACSARHPVVLSETRGGDVVYQVEPERSGSRADVPVGVEPDAVVAQIRTPSAGIVTVTRSGEVYMDDTARAEGVTVVLPARPWWYWPWTVLKWLVIAAAVAFGGILMIRLARR